jgi:DNA polymerase III subunit epsilon
VILFFDTETSGLWRRDLPEDHQDQPHLVSLAAQLCDDEKVIHQISLVFSPQHFIIPKEASDVHGIPQDYALKVGIHSNIGLEMFTDMLSKCDTLIAHNTAFDLQIIERSLKFHNVNFVKPRKIYCTMMMAKDVLQLPGEYGDYKYPKLQETFEHFFHGGKQEYHDALLDVTLCREIYFHMLRQGVESVAPREIPKALLKRIDGDKYKNLVKFLKELDNSKLSLWENDFCKSLIEKLDKLDEHILVSEKQHNVLRKIYDKQNN